MGEQSTILPTGTSLAIIIEEVECLGVLWLRVTYTRRSISRAATRHESRVN